MENVLPFRVRDLIQFPFRILWVIPVLARFQSVVTSTKRRIRKIRIIFVSKIYFCFNIYQRNRFMENGMTNKE